MLEVVFSDSAAGSMAEACCQGGGAVASSVGVIVGHHEDGSPFTEAETEEYRRQFEERERRAWQNALPFESRREDILCFPLALSVGDIRGEGIGPGREAALKKLMSVYPAEGREAAGELLGRQLPAGELRALAAQWHWMQKENAPLRAVLNGRLLSADESLYDPYILREIAAQGEEFQQAAVVGRVLGRYQLGIADACVALRMEEFIQNGLLEPVTSAAPGNPVYHRVLRRAGR